MFSLSKEISQEQAKVITSGKISPHTNQNSKRKHGPMQPESILKGLCHRDFADFWP